MEREVVFKHIAKLTNFATLTAGESPFGCETRIIVLDNKQVAIFVNGGHWRYEFADTRLLHTSTLEKVLKALEKKFLNETVYADENEKTKASTQEVHLSDIEALACLKAALDEGGEV